MAYTFDPALSTERDWIRAALGDTETSTAVLTDEQIAAVLAAELAQTGGTRQTAIWCLAAQMEATISKAPVKVDAAGIVTDFSQRLLALTPLANAWRVLSAQRATPAADTTVQRSTSHGVTVTPVW